MKVVKFKKKSKENFLIYGFEHTKKYHKSS